MAIVGILVLLAAFRPAGMDSDYDTYVEYYHGNTNQIVEFTFMGIGSGSRLIQQPTYSIFRLCSDEYLFAWLWNRT